MGAQDNGLTLEGLAHRLETLERENERLRSENAAIRSKVATLEGSGTRRNEPAETSSLVPRWNEERASRVDGAVSRRSLLSKAGAAAVVAVAAGTLVYPREAKANHYAAGIEVDFVRAHETSTAGTAIAGEASGLGVVGRGFTGVSGTSSGVGDAGVRGNRATTGFLEPIEGYGVIGSGAGAAYAGVWGHNPRQGPGVRGEGVIGVWGTSSTEGQAGVYAEHKTTAGPGVVGDANGPGYAGVLGRNSSSGFDAFGVKGETVDGVGVKGIGKNGVIGESPTLGHAAVYGQHTGTAGYGIVGDGTGSTGSGVAGRNPNGNGVEGLNSRYGGKFAGSRAQLMLVPKSTAGTPTAGTHTKGEIYMDSVANLFVCVASSTDVAAAKWRKVSTTAV